MRDIGPKNLLQEVWLWIIVLSEYFWDVCRYGFRGAEEKSLDEGIKLIAELQLMIDKFRRGGESP